MARELAFHLRCTNKSRDSSEPPAQLDAADSIAESALPFEGREAMIIASNLIRDFEVCGTKFQQRRL
jgi:hypothetical protein